MRAQHAETAMGMAELMRRRQAADGLARRTFGEHADELVGAIRRARRGSYVYGAVALDGTWLGCRDARRLMARPDVLVRCWPADAGYTRAELLASLGGGE